MSITRRTFLTSSLAVGAASTVATAACSGARGAGQGVDSASAEAALDPRFAALVGFCDDIPAVSEAERAAHRSHARELATELGYDALIMEAGVNLVHFAGLSWWPSERPLLYVMPSQGEGFFVGPAFEEGTLRKSGLADADLRTWHEHISPYPLVSAGLAERGVRAGRVALDPAMRGFVSHGLAAAGGRLSFEHGAAVFEGCRIRKQAPELARLRRANEATKAALALVAEHVEPGMSETDVSQLVQAAQGAAGLERIWSLVAFGENAAYPHGSPEKRPLRSGDLVLVDTGGSLHGYRSDITRTWPIGPVSALSDDVRKAWDTTLEAQSAALAMIRPGVSCGEVDAAARAVMKRAGHGDEYKRFTHRLGHGIGREVHEAPYLVAASERILEPGMTMSNEPGIYIPGSLGVRIEDIVAVTDSGNEVFGVRAESLERPFGVAPSEA